MNNNVPDFFKNRTTSWRFEDVLLFIKNNFEIGQPFEFRVGDRKNCTDENQRAAIVLAYAQLMDYNLYQVKALFSEHDHFAIAMPETRKGRNILEINKIFVHEVQKGKNPQDLTICTLSPDYFEIPSNMLHIK